MNNNNDHFDDFYSAEDDFNYPRSNRALWISIFKILIPLACFIFAIFWLWRSWFSSFLASSITVTPAQVTVTLPIPSLQPIPVASPTLTIATSVPLPILIATQAPISQSLDSNALAYHMLTLVNADRRAASLPPVQWDDLAAKIAADHAKEMGEQNYVSHWNLKGYGPDIRYSFGGGLDAWQENVAGSWRRFTNGTPVPITNWDAEIQRSQEGLMNSPGHRANILAPAHTHVGIGSYYHAATGEFRLVQLFINRYVILAPLPHRVKQGDVLIIEGELLATVSNPLMALAYEPFPTPMTVTQLNATSSYSSPAKDIEIIRLTTAGNRIFGKLKIDTKGKEGLLHVQVFVDINSKQAQATDVIIEVLP